MIREESRGGPMKNIVRASGFSLPVLHKGLAPCYLQRLPPSGVAFPNPRPPGSRAGFKEKKKFYPTPGVVLERNRHYSRVDPKLIGITKSGKSDLFRTQCLMSWLGNSLTQIYSYNSSSISVQLSVLYSASGFESGWP